MSATASAGESAVTKDQIPIDKWMAARDDAREARTFLDGTIGRRFRKLNKPQSWMLDKEKTAKVDLVLRRGAAAIEEQARAAKKVDKKVPFLKLTVDLYTQWRPSLRLVEPTDGTPKQNKAYKVSRKTVTDQMLGEGRFSLSVRAAKGLRRFKIAIHTFKKTPRSVYFVKLLVQMLMARQKLYPACFKLLVKDEGWEDTKNLELAAAEWEWGLHGSCSDWAAFQKLKAEEPTMLHCLIESVLQVKIPVMTRWIQLAKKIDAHNRHQLEQAAANSSVRTTYHWQEKVININAIHSRWEEALWEKADGNGEEYERMWMQVAKDTKVVTRGHRAFAVVLESGREYLRRLLQATPQRMRELCGELELRDDLSMQHMLSETSISDDQGGGRLRDEYDEHGKRKRLKLGIDNGQFTKAWACQTWITPGTGPARVWVLTELGAAKAAASLAAARAQTAAAMATRAVRQCAWITSN